MSVHELRPKISEAEKITINLGSIDLGQIDLLVQEGFYSNRTDLIRTAIRNKLAIHADVIKQTVNRKSLVLGLASIGLDVPPELALSTIDSITVLGALHASSTVKTALAGRIH